MRTGEGWGAWKALKRQRSDTGKTLAAGYTHCGGFPFTAVRVLPNDYCMETGVAIVRRVKHEPRWFSSRCAAAMVNVAHKKEVPRAVAQPQNNTQDIYMSAHMPLPPASEQQLSIPVRSQKRK